MREKTTNIPHQAAVGERRSQPRIPVHHEQNLAPAQEGPDQLRVVTARLVDVSDGGVGVETGVPVPVGATVSIAGELHSSEFCVGIEGPVRVAHCRRCENGLFRIGLAFAGAVCRNIVCNHELEARKPSGPGASIAIGKLPGGGEEGVYIPGRLWGDFRVIVSAELL